MSGMSQADKMHYSGLFNTATEQVRRGVDSTLMVVIAQDPDFYSTHFAGGGIEYPKNSDDYKADALAGSSSDSTAAVVSKVIRGRNSITVLIAAPIGSTHSTRDLKKVSKQICDRMVAITKDAKV